MNGTILKTTKRTTLVWTLVLALMALTAMPALANHGYPHGGGGGGGGGGGNCPPNNPGNQGNPPGNPKGGNQGNCPPQAPPPHAQNPTVKSSSPSSETRMEGGSFGTGRCVEITFPGKNGKPPKDPILSPGCNTGQAALAPNVIATALVNDRGEFAVSIPRANLAGTDVVQVNGTGLDAQDYVAFVDVANNKGAEVTTTAVLAKTLAEAGAGAELLGTGASAAVTGPATLGGAFATATQAVAEPTVGLALIMMLLAALAAGLLLARYRSRTTS